MIPVADACRCLQRAHALFSPPQHVSPEAVALLAGAAAGHLGLSSAMQAELGKGAGGPMNLRAARPTSMYSAGDASLHPANGQAAARPGASANTPSRKDPGPCSGPRAPCRQAPSPGGVDEATLFEGQSKALIAAATSALAIPFHSLDPVEIAKSVAKPRPPSSEELFDLPLPALAKALSALYAARSPETGWHCHRVADHATAIGRRLALPPSELAILGPAALLHDLGKLGLPDQLLSKRGRLTSAEADTMRRHTSLGADLFGGMPTLARLGRIIGEHHEKMDGSGYPLGLKGGEQEPLPRIVVVADVYDALTTKRAYKRALSRSEALKIMRGDMAGAFDPEILALALADDLSRIGAAAGG